MDGWTANCANWALQGQRLGCRVYNYRCNEACNEAPFHFIFARTVVSTRERRLSNWVACMWKHVTFTQGLFLSSTHHFKAGLELRKRPSDQGTRSDRVSGVKRDQQWMWKNTADSSVQREVQRWRNEAASPRQHDAFSSNSQVFGVMTHFIRLLRRPRWYGDSKDSGRRETWPKLPFAAYQSDSPFCIPMAAKEAFSISGSPPTLFLLPTSSFFSRVIINMLMIWAVSCTACCPSSHAYMKSQRAPATEPGS